MVVGYIDYRNDPVKTVAEIDHPTAQPPSYAVTSYPTTMHNIAVDVANLGDMEHARSNIATVQTRVLVTGGKHDGGWLNVWHSTHMCRHEHAHAKSRAHDTFACVRACVHPNTLHLSIPSHTHARTQSISMSILVECLFKGTTTVNTKTLFQFSLYLVLPLHFAKFRAILFL